MTVTHGADVAALRGLGVACGGAAGRLDEATVRLRAGLDALTWGGADAQRFRGDWEGVHATALLRVAAALREAGATVHAHADEQEAASADATAAATLTSTPAPGYAPPSGPSAGDAARERAERAWARGAGRLVLGGLGALFGPAGALAGSLGGPRLVDALVGVADARADRTRTTELTAAQRAAVPAGRVPTSPADLYDAMNEVYDVDGAVRVQTIARADGSRVAVVAIPGTQSWSLRPGEDPYGVPGAVASASGADSPQRATVLAAMRQAGIGPDVPVVLVGHSQSGFTALDLAADPYVRSAHRIEAVITAGAGGGQFDVPAHVTVVSVRNPVDPVARIGGAPDGAIDVIGGWRGEHPHSSERYAGVLRASGDPRLHDWWESLGLEGATGVEDRIFVGRVGDPAD